MLILKPLSTFKALDCPTVGFEEGGVTADKLFPEGPEFFGREGAKERLQEDRRFPHATTNVITEDFQKLPRLALKVQIFR